MAVHEFIQDTKKRKLFLLTCAWLLIVLGAFLLRNILLPFFLAALLAYVLDPAVSWIHRFKVRNTPIPRGLAVIAVYVLLAGFLYLLSVFFLPELYRELIRFVRSSSEAINQFNTSGVHTLAERIDAFFSQYNLPVHIKTLAPTEQLEPGHAPPLISIDLAQVFQNIADESVGYLRAQSTGIVGELHDLVEGVIRFVFQFFLVFMLAGFILADTGRIKRFAARLIVSDNINKFEALLARLDKGLSGVVRGQLVICVVNATLTLIGLLLLQMKFALILSLLAGVFSLIPIFGSIISTLPIALVALMNSPTTLLLAVLWVVMIHALEANFLNPKIMGNSAKIHPVLVVLALVAGEHYYGLAGALLAVPIASIVLTVFHSLIARAQEDEVF